MAIDASSNFKAKFTLFLLEINVIGSYQENLNILWTIGKVVSVLSTLVMKWTSKIKYILYINLDKLDILCLVYICFLAHTCNKQMQPNFVSAVRFWRCHYKGQVHFSYSKHLTPIFMHIISIFNPTI